MNERIAELERRIEALEQGQYLNDIVRDNIRESVFVRTATSPVTQNFVIGEEGTFTLAKIPVIYLVAEYKGKLYKLYAEEYDGTN